MVSDRTDVQKSNGGIDSTGLLGSRGTVSPFDLPNFDTCRGEDMVSQRTNPLESDSFPWEELLAHIREKDIAKRVVPVIGDSAITILKNGKTHRFSDVLGEDLGRDLKIEGRSIATVADVAAVASKEQRKILPRTLRRVHDSLLDDVTESALGPAVKYLCAITDWPFMLTTTTSQLLGRTLRKIHGGDLETVVLGRSEERDVPTLIPTAPGFRLVHLLGQISEQLKAPSGSRRARCSVDEALKLPNVSYSDLSKLIDRRILQYVECDSVRMVELKHDLFVKVVETSGRDLSFLTERSWNLFTSVIEAQMEGGGKATYSDLPGKICDLLKDVRAATSKVATVRDYRRLRDVATLWQTVLSQLFHQPTTAGPLPRPKQLVAVAPLPDKEIEAEVRHNADILSKVRVIVKFLNSDIEQNDRKNWLDACFLLGLQCLEGTVDFVTDLPAESYKRLEELPIKYVKQAAAYLVWVSRGSPTKDDDPDDNYKVACQKLRSGIKDPNLKRPAISFERVEEYLKSRYYSDEGRHRLIGSKSLAIYATTDCRDDWTNWLNAEKYVHGFYDNIIPAVRHGSIDNVSKVLQALRMSETGQYGCSITNCFETAIVFYFLASDKIEATGIRLDDVI